MPNEDAHALIGQRVRECRRYRGLTLQQLADRAGLSKGFLSLVENGKRRLDNIGHITAIADALEVSPTELTGQPYPPMDPTQSQAHASLTAIRLALMDVSCGDPFEQTTPRPLPLLRDAVTEANQLYHACDYATLGSRLPRLIRELHAAIDQSIGAERAEAIRLAIHAYHPACTLLLKYLGVPDLAWIAVTHVERLVRQLDDPLYHALHAHARAHVLLSAGAHEARQKALVFARQAADELAPHTANSDALALLGELNLLAATTLSTLRNPLDAADHLAIATDIATHTGETTSLYLNFGPTNVGIHRVSTAVELRDGGKAVEIAQRERADLFAIPSINSVGRQATYFADLGRGLAQMGRRDQEALRALRTAERLAPQRIRTNPMVREVVAHMLRRARREAGGRELRGMAYRMGIAGQRSDLF